MHKTKTLYGVVKQVESSYDVVSQYTAVDKKDGLKRVFEEWKQNNVVKAVMGGENTFGGEYQKIFGGYKIKELIMPNRLRGNDPEVFRTLEACLGESGLGYVRPNIVNSSVGGLGFAAFLSLLASKANKKMSRREFLGYSALLTSLGGLIGVGVSAIDANELQKNLKKLEQNASYLDRMYSFAYKGT